MFLNLLVPKIKGQPSNWKKSLNKLLELQFAGKIATRFISAFLENNEFFVLVHISSTY